MKEIKKIDDTLEVKLAGIDDPNALRKMIFELSERNTELSEKNTELSEKNKELNDEVIGLKSKLKKNILKDKDV